MRWRLRFWFNKRDAKGKCTEPAPIDRETHPINEERYVYFHREDDARKLGQSIAKPGDSFELRLAPQCAKCSKEQLDHTEKDLQKKGWGGNGDEMICPSCGGARGEPEAQRRLALHPITEVADPTAPKKHRAHRENGVRLIEQLKQRVETLTKRLDRLKAITPNASRVAGEPRKQPRVTIKQVENDNRGVSEYTIENARGIALKKED